MPEFIEMTLSFTGGGYVDPESIRGFMYSIDSNSLQQASSYEMPVRI